MNENTRFHRLQPNSEMCFGCGRANPVGLYMKFRDDGVDRVLSEYTVAQRYQGYPGLVHGGVIATMLDEAVARVSFIGDPHHFMMSVKLQVSFRHPIPVETPLRVIGRIVRLR
jgi:acyl-coenzyme A thioesterase PaaI-like protein